MKLIHPATALLAVSLAASPASAETMFERMATALADTFMGERQTEDFDWKGQVAAGRKVEVYGINGAVTVSPSSGRAVTLHAVKSGRRSHPSEVKVQVVEHAGGLTICAVYPTPAGESPNTCKPGGGSQHSRNNDVSVEFTLAVPADVELDAQTVNGGIDVSGLQGDVKGETVNGSVRLATAGRAEAETVNGSISAKMGRAGEPLHFETVNGSISIELPQSANATIQARTVNGSIHSELDLKNEERSRRSLDATLGSGGPKLSLETVNGSIKLRAGS